MGTSIHLEDKYTATAGRVFMTGTQALIRLPMAQMRRDRQQGLKTASFITGYRGSPLGAYDQQLQQAAAHLQPLDITFQPGLNEDLAATAIWGTQQLGLSAGATHDGVLGIWYGKGPGVDRCGDVFKHGNAAGSAEHGGVLCIAGDDHAAKSSTLPHQSDHAFMAAVMPVLYPSSIHEFIDVGLFGIAMSRFAGVWVGYKVISDTVETSAVVNLGDEQRQFVVPEDFELPVEGLNLRWPDAPLVQDDRLQELKAYAALAFARANRIDDVVVDSRQARLGIIATGKSFEDVRQALVELGLDQDAIETIGLRVYKVRMPWPLEPQGVRQFSEGLEEVLIIEERREIIENQIKQQLFNWRADVRPRIVGKFDDEDRQFLPLSQALSISRVARAIAERVLRLPLEESLKRRISDRLAYLQRRADERASHVAPIERQPWFCSGCPHNTSTRVPEGSKAMAGIGCHYMVQWMGRDTDTFTQMGGEGVPWTSIARYTREKHRFVNLGDGTYLHSGLLAIRASVNSGVNITYKVLYNDAVAMTGGQTLDGDLTPARITHQLHAEKVSPIYLVSDAPEAHHSRDLAAGVMIRHRDELDAVQREVREMPGCSAIVYEQTCAAEKRRRRKRGELVDPARRVHIDTAVCEGCGDCSVQSNCVSIEPIETIMGRKRRINQSSCNKDFSCLKGFCPSFVTVEGGSLKKAARQGAGDLSDLPDPVLPVLGDRPWNIAITGVGGTGVLTIGAILGMSAHIDGHASLILDMAGLAQKGGAVLSHVRLAASPGQVTSPHIVAGGADCMIAADDVVAASRDGVVLCDPARTVAIVNTATQPVAAFVNARDLDFRARAVSDTIGRVVRDKQHFRGFSEVASALLGDTIATNIMMLGYAWQCALVPISGSALREAIALNGVAVEANLAAFDWGRLLAAEPERVLEQVKKSTAVAVEPVQAELDLDTLIQQRQAHLLAYQGKSLAMRFSNRIAQFRARTASVDPEGRLARSAALAYSRLLAVKDEYEVARLYSTPGFRERLDAEFTGDYSLSFHLAPPLLGGKDATGRPRKRRFGPWVLTLFKWLQYGRHVRGTAFDPLGRTEEKRLDRAWVVDFEADMTRLAESLNASVMDTAEAILQVPDAIRGYGPVRLAAMAQARERRAALWQDFERPQPVDVGRVAA